MQTYNTAIFFNKQINMFLQKNIIGTTRCMWKSKAFQAALDSSPPGWYKWNTSASRMEQTKSTTTSYVHRQ